jgi:hypothetical protein
VDIPAKVQETRIMKLFSSFLNWFLVTSWFAVSSPSKDHHVHHQHSLHHSRHHSNSSSSYRLPIVFVYTVMKASCSASGLPSYIRTSLEQAIFTQPDAQVILLSNLRDCHPMMEDSVKGILHLEVIDSLSIISERTKHFENVSSTLFLDSWEPLWMTSALRFFFFSFISFFFLPPASVLLVILLFSFSCFLSLAFFCHLIL